MRRIIVTIALVTATALFAITRDELRVKRSTEVAVLNPNLISREVRAVFKYPGEAARARCLEEFIKSRPILEAASKQPEVQALSLIQEQHDPIRWLAENLTVACPGPHYVARLTIKGTRREATAILDSVSKAINAEFDARKNRVLERVDRASPLFLNDPRTR